MQTDLAHRTLERASAAMQTTRIACVPEIVKLLSTLSGNTDEVSVTELAEVVQNDPIVLSKVIGAANTYYYNPNAVAVTNVIQAIHVIGFERIRSLAMSLILAEQAARGQSAEEQRAIAAQSLVAGCLAQSMAAHRVLLDKDRAFVCGCLRSFGHVVLASCMFEEYKSARNHPTDVTDDEAYRACFGLTPLELGYHLLQAAHLPDEVLAALRALPAEAIAEAEPKPDNQMLAIAECADRIAEITCDSRISTEEFAARSTELVRRYEKILPELKEELHGVMQAATGQMDFIVRTFRLRSLPARTLARMRSCRNAVDPERPTAQLATPPIAANTTPAQSATHLAPAATSPPESASPRDLPVSPENETKPECAGAPARKLSLPNHDWQAGIKRLARVLGEPGATRAKLRGEFVALLAQGMGASDCLLFIHQPKQSGFTLAEGSGRLHQRLLSGRPPTLHHEERTVFGVCLQRNENVNIHHAHDSRISAYLPLWFKHQTELGSFVLIPFSDTVQPQGVVLIGWPEACHIHLPSFHAHAIRTTIGFVTKALLRLPE